MRPFPYKQEETRKDSICQSTFCMFESAFLLFQKTLSHDSVTSSTGRHRWPLYELGEGSFVLPDPAHELDASCRIFIQHRPIDNKEAFDETAFLNGQTS